MHLFLIVWPRSSGGGGGGAAYMLMCARLCWSSRSHVPASPKMLLQSSGRVLGPPQLLCLVCVSTGTVCVLVLVVY